MATYNAREVNVTFVELEFFTVELLRVADESTLQKFQDELASNPELGDLIRHSGGLRKARMKLPGRGKSAGARVIYLWLPKPSRIILLMLYTKSSRVDLPPATLSKLEALTTTLKERYNL